MTNFIQKPFDKSRVEELVSFSQENSLYPFHSTSLMKRFMLDLTSTPDNVLDLFIDNQRSACAVIIDRPENGANSANLEILGIFKDQNLAGIYNYILSWAKSRLPKNRSSVDATFHQSLGIGEDVFLSNGFKESYSMYEMKTDRPKLLKAPLPTSIALEILSEAEFSEYHEVVMSAFKSNEDANIPPLKEMRPYLLKSKIAPRILKSEGKIIGFFSVLIDERNPSSGTINTIGVLPEFRRLGLGQILLEKAIECLTDNGADQFDLSVSATNEKALGLYKRVGFKIADSSKNYRYRP